MGRAVSARHTGSPQRAYWLKTLHQWHWISSAMCLIGMLLFAITGITLNNAGKIGATPEVTTLKQTLPPEMAALLQAARPQATRQPHPCPELRGWIEQSMKVELDTRDAEWSPERSTSRCRAGR